MKSWIPLAHQEAEKFIYKMVYDKLFERFSRKHKDKDQLFSKKTQQLAEFTDLELLKNLDVHKKFVLGDADLQYIDAIMELSKIESFQTPKSKLVASSDSQDCLVMMNSEMRSAVIKHHHAKTEIEGMDHELPVTIFIVSRAKCRKLASNLQYILSFLKTKEESDHQERILNTVMVALDYICSDWKIEDIKKLSSPEDQQPTTSN